MSDELLPYYQRELAFIRTMGAQFAEKNPKIASRLRLRAEGAHDPHVERMIEAFAYLNARIRHKLDDDFPELTHAMLDVLYPHYLAPVPSMAIAQLELHQSQAQATSGYEVPSDASLETDTIQGQPCRFRTCYPVLLWPIQVSTASLAGPPFQAPVTGFSAKTSEVLHLRLECLSKEVQFADLPIEFVRFYLKGQAQHTFPLYELIFNNTIGVALVDPENRSDPFLLKPSSLRPVGFERDEGMIPYPSRSFLGYRLLSEYFTFPDKFLFFDVSFDDLDTQRHSLLGNAIDVYLYLDRALPEIEHGVTKDTFQLGCTPALNLFQQRAEPIRLNQSETEYRVVPDARRPLATEVFSIDRVIATSPSNEEVEYEPFYSFRHTRLADRQRTFFHATRRAASRSSTSDLDDQGTEIFLTFVDLDFSPNSPADWTVDVETTCLNRDLPHRLPFGGGEPRLHLSEGGSVNVQFLTPPTPTYRPALRNGATWRLISHLSLNHLSITDVDDGADALREILKIYDFADSEETRSMIDGILSVTTRRVVARSGQGPSGGVCRGVEVTLDFDEDHFVGSGVYLFACVLERFLGLYCSINSFTRLVAKSTKREGALRTWAPRAGEQILL